MIPLASLRPQQKWHPDRGQYEAHWYALDSCAMHFNAYRYSYNQTHSLDVCFLANNGTRSRRV